MANNDKKKLTPLQIAEAKLQEVSLSRAQATDNLRRVEGAEMVLTELVKELKK